jgi:hypothetical protein
MQLSAQILQAGWHDLLGWALIVVGIALAVQTLVFVRPRSRVAHILRAYRPEEWLARQSAHERVPPMDPSSQLQRLTAIAEKAFTQTQAIADQHARAAQELEAADDALVRLLADFEPGTMLPAGQHEVIPAPAPLAEPLAA